MGYDADDDQALLASPDEYEMVELHAVGASDPADGESSVEAERSLAETKHLDEPPTPIGDEPRAPLLALILYGIPQINIQFSNSLLSVRAKHMCCVRR